MKIKICGLKSRKDVLFCAYEGANALGFFVSNEDNNALSLDEAKSLIASVPPFTASILVTDATTSSAVISMAYYTAPSAIQLQKSLDVGEIAQIKRSIPCCKLIKTVYVDDEEELFKMQDYLHVVDLLLIDNKNNNLVDEEAFRKIVQKITIPVIFSEKIFEKYQNVELPYCVDVKESVENLDGSKDYEKIISFIKKIKTYNTLNCKNRFCFTKKNFYLFNHFCQCNKA